MTQREQTPAVLAGVLYALAAGLCWGMVFVAPLWLADYSPGMLAFGRYTAFGVIALGIAWFQRTALTRLNKADWIEAGKLSLVGNILYYLALAGAIQLANAPIPTMIIGTLPVVISVSANLLARRNSQVATAWERMLPPLIAIAAGLALVHHTEEVTGHTGALPFFWWGILLAVIALACWTWYPLRNSHWLGNNTHIDSAAWATAQGIATLPLALTGFAVLAIAGQFDLGTRTPRYIAIMFLIGLFASWIGTWCWNRASQLLPPSLVGQLIVFETLAALAYAFAWRGQAPNWNASLGIALLVAGVLLGLRAFKLPSSKLPSTTAHSP
jgi:drug/metabolite transporter (DMT)-like permease